MSKKMKSESGGGLAFASIEELSALLVRRKVSPVELVKMYLERIKRHNSSLNAYLTVMAERAMVDARAAEKRLVARRARGPLDGIPICIKDNIWTRGTRTTAGSKVLDHFIPENDATVVTQLRRAGCASRHPQHQLPRRNGRLVRPAERSSASQPGKISRIFPETFPSFTVSRPTVTGSLNLLGPALPELK